MFPSLLCVFVSLKKKKHIFLHYEYFKYMFSQHFLNHIFYIILINNTQTPLPNKQACLYVIPNNSF